MGGWMGWRGRLWVCMWVVGEDQLNQNASTTGVGATGIPVQCHSPGAESEPLHGAPCIPVADNQAMLAMASYKSNIGPHVNRLGMTALKIELQLHAAPAARTATNRRFRSAGAVLPAGTEIASIKKLHRDLHAI